MTEPTLAFARLAPGVDFGASDGRADIVFMIAAPDGAAEVHLAVLSKLARSLIHDDFTAALRAARTPDGCRGDRRGGDRGGGCRGPVAAARGRGDRRDRPRLTVTAGPRGIVGVTACATGIAHTYMAADALTAAGKAAGVELHVETQGSSGYQALRPASSRAPTRSIFANDVDVRDAAASPASRSCARPSSAASTSPTR